MNLLDKEKISVQKLYNTTNQNNSVINSYFDTPVILFVFILVQLIDTINKRYEQKSKPGFYTILTTLNSSTAETFQFF